MWLKPLKNVSDNQLKHIAASAGIVLALMLMLVKIFASLYTGSLAILSSLVDSISDILASVISLVAVRFSSLPASFGHRYGFGKIEALSALIQSAFVAGSGLFVIYEGVDRFINPTVLVDTDFGIGVMIFSLVCTIAVVYFQQYVAKKTDSIAVEADSAHYVVDIASNVAIILGLVVVKFFGIEWFDPLAAVFVSAYLLRNAYKIAKGAVALLLDKELPDEVREKVIAAVKGCDFCRGVHDLRSRDSGGIYMFELHLELDGNLPLYEAHRFTDIAESKIKELYPKSQVIIHQDPAGFEEERLDNKLAK